MEITSDSDELEVHSSRSRFLKDSEASGLNEASNKLVLNCSTSKICSFSRKGKFQGKNGVEELKERLDILEVETEAMKQAFVQTMEERKKLVNEVYEDFLKLHHRRHSENQVTGLKFLDRSLITDPSKEAVMTRGLSQVLLENSSPCIVTRDHKPNMHFSLFS